MTVLTGAPLLPTYARFPVTFVDGDGSWLIDEDGKRYLDLIAGIAVVSLGHGHPAPLEAAQAQLERLWHVSNLYSTLPMEELATKLSARFGGAHAFFCNSGGEAIEAAIKWARKVTARSEFVAFEGSFHGRTTGALALTGQPAKRAAFEPLLPGVRFVTPDTLGDAVGPQTAAIFLEPVQGEGGVWPFSLATLAEARRLADEFGALLVFDEVQTGVGRTGEFFAWQHSGIRPDALTLAKGLANGLPIGSLLVSDHAPTGFEPGDHASTFGGNPVACAAACAVVDTVDDELARPRSRPRRAIRGRVRRDSRHRPAARARARPAGVPGRTPCARTGPPRRHRGRDRAADHAAAHDLHRRSRPGDRAPARGAVVSTKFERQGAILRLIENRHLSTQGRELAEALRLEGIDTVQTTISRDIAQLGLVKVRNGNGRLIYALPGGADLRRLEQLGSALRTWAISMVPAGPLLVIHTPRGLAAALADAIDESSLHEVAGTIAGDNTVFVAVREGTSAQELSDSFTHHIDRDTDS